jgi:hypothetical protein
MAGIELVVPNAKGDIERYLIRENSNFDAELKNNILIGRIVEKVF